MGMKFLIILNVIFVSIIVGFVIFGIIYQLTKDPGYTSNIGNIMCQKANKDLNFGSTLPCNIQVFTNANALGSPFVFVVNVIGKDNTYNKVYFATSTDPNLLVMPSRLVIGHH